MNGDRGFTLIELMIVMVILSVVAVITVPRLSGTLSRQIAVSELRTLESSINAKRRAAIDGGRKSCIEVKTKDSEDKQLICFFPDGSSSGFLKQKISYKDIDYQLSISKVFSSIDVALLDE